LDQPAWFASGWFGVRGHSREVENNTRLVADCPTIVACGNRHDISGTNLKLCAIIHANDLTPRDDVADVRHLTRVSPGDRPHVIGPLPPGLKNGAADSAATDVDDLDSTFVLHWASLIGSVEALTLKCHQDLLRLNGSSTTLFNNK
jgi:hypothetical protein